MVFVARAGLNRVMAFAVLSKSTVHAAREKRLGYTSFFLCKLDRASASALLTTMLGASHGVCSPKTVASFELPKLD